MHQERANRTPSQQWGLRVGMEVVTATMLGLGAGYVLDLWLGTRPWLLIVFALFGIAAGFANLYHIMVVRQPPQSDDSS